MLECVEHSKIKNIVKGAVNIINDEAFSPVP